jgi:peptide/nickel transport system substrate-binding protein
LGRRITRRDFVRGGAATVAATGITTLAGCTGATTASPTAPPAAPPPPAAAGAATATAAPPPVKYGGIYHEGDRSDMPNLDPHEIVSYSFHVTGAGIAYSKLMQFRTDVSPDQLIPTGDLAESWEQPDDTTYIFKIRKNAKWQNIAPVSGRPVVAQDIKYSYERQIARNVTASDLGGLSKVEAVDPQTLKITLNKPDADFLASLAVTRNKIIPHEAVELKGDLKEGPVIGSGPWIFQKWEKATIVTHTRNPDYYFPGFPRAAGIEFPRVKDVSAERAAFRTQQIDALAATGLTPREAEDLRKTDPNNFEYQSFKTPNGVYVGLNTTKPPFNDLRVRQAIFKAINKQQIMDAILDGKAWYFVGIQVPSADANLPDAEVREAYKQDLPAAKRLLADAGIKPGTEIDTIVLNISQTYVDIAELIKAQLVETGISLVLRPGDTNLFIPNVYRDATYQMAVSPTSPAVSANNSLFNVHRSNASRSASHLSDPKLDAMIDQQAGLARDPEGRKKLLQEIQRYILNSAHQFHVYGQFAHSLRWKYMKDFFPAAPSIEETYIRMWLDK